MQVVFIHGPAAAGKLTIARQLADLTGYRLFHNHLTVDLAASLFEFGSSPFRALRETIWLAAFEQAARHGVSFIFTFHPEASVDPGFVERARQRVAAAGGELHFVQLECPEPVVEQRLATPDRKKFGKLTDLELYRRLREEGAFEFPELPPPLIRIPSHQVSPEEAARRIAEKLHLA